MDFKGKCGLIIGSGESGRGAEYALKKLGANSEVIDTEYIPTDMNKYDFIVVSPGIRHDHPAYKYSALHNVPIYGEIGLGAILNTAPVLGVTGTNGKTTTVGMLGSIYESAKINAVVCGNIGVSFARTSADGGYDRAIIELSSFQLLQASPLKVHIACITNLSADHLDYHGNMLEYRHAKLKIADGQTAEDFLIVPEKFNLVGISGTPTIIRFGKDCYEKNGELYAFGKPFMSTSELNVKGAHNVENALNSALMAMLDGISAEDVRRGLMNFKSDKYRLSLVGEYNDVKFYNDSKGTNISACLSATKCMKGSTSLIVGGSDKGYDYDDLFLGLPEMISAVFVTGDNAEKIMTSAHRMGYKNIMLCSSLAEAVKRSAGGGFDNALFSPASASFDRYANYKERGDAFEREVKKLFGAN